jgi:CRP/FNR family transcriptional regulator
LKKLKELGIFVPDLSGEEKMVRRENQLHIRVSSGIYRELKVQCALKGSTLQEYFTKLINENVLQSSNGESSKDIKFHESTLIDLFHSCPLLKSVDVSELEKLADTATIFNYKKTRLIIREGQIPHSFQIIKSGLVKIFKTFPSGKQFVLDICYSGDTFGEIAVIEGIPHYTSAQAQEDTEIVSVPRTSFLNIIAHNPDATLKIASREIQRVHNLSDRLIGLVTDTADLRVVKVLYALTLKCGDILHFSHKDIAEMSGTTTETATRILRELESRGIIEINRIRVGIIDKNKLKSYYK